MLQDGYIEWLKAQEQEYDSGSSGYETEDDGYDPRFPRSTDRLATGEELMALGIQYTQE